MGRKRKHVTTREYKYNKHGDTTKITDTSDIVGSGITYLIPIILAAIITIVIIFLTNSIFGLQINLFLFFAGITPATYTIAIGLLIFIIIFLRIRTTFQRK